MKKIASEGEGRIILALSEGEKKWNELLELTGLSKKGLAKHLKRLIEKGVIMERIDSRDRRVKIYSLNPDLAPKNVIKEALTIVLLKKIVIELLELDIKGIESGQDIKKEVYSLIARHYFTLSLDKEGVEIVLKALKYLAIGWNYVFERFADEEIVEWLEREFTREKEEILKEGIVTLRLLLEQAYIYKWIAQHGGANLDKIKKIGLELRKDPEVVERIIRNIQLIHKNIENLVEILKTESLMSPVVKKMWEKVEKELEGNEIEYIKEHIIKLL